MQKIFLKGQLAIAGLCAALAISARLASAQIPPVVAPKPLPVLPVPHGWWGYRPPSLPDETEAYIVPDGVFRRGTDIVVEVVGFRPGGTTAAEKFHSRWINAMSDQVLADTDIEPDMANEKLGDIYKRFNLKELTPVGPFNDVHGRLFWSDALSSCNWPLWPSYYVKDQENGAIRKLKLVERFATAQRFHLAPTPDAFCPVTREVPNGAGLRGNPDHVMSRFLALQIMHLFAAPDGSFVVLARESTDGRGHFLLRLRSDLTSPFLSSQSNLTFASEAQVEYLEVGADNREIENSLNQLDALFPKRR